MTTVTGNVNISNNPVATTIDLGCVTTVGGSITVENNDAATNIDLGSVTTVGGSITVENNNDATVLLGSLETVAGSISVESTGTDIDIFDITACAGGSSDISTMGYASVLATTAAGATSVTAQDDNAINIALQPSTVSACTPFAITRVPVAPEAGTDADGNAATINPIDAYQIEFAVPTLGTPATLTFDIILANLDAASQTEVLNAVATGVITLVTKSDTAGSTYQAFPICAGSEAPTVDGCVLLETLDSNRQPTTGTPAIVRFSNVVGHFSTWAVAIVTPPVFFNGLLQPYPVPPYTTTPTFKRGSVVPLKFNWVDAAGRVIDSGAASPAISIYRDSCSDQPAMSEPIAADDAGQSDGWRYDAAASTWIFGWSTKPLTAGCYWIQVTTATRAYPAPTGLFPVALRDK